MQPAIKIRDIAKRYRIGHVSPERTLREAIMEGAAAPFRTIASWASRRTGERPNPQVTDLWALRDISFDVLPGELLGLIGQNGAGKSTLLKILSRITEPTAGRVELHGRVGSLLEVGTGFHGELTGRENIFLSGSILGMRRVEIQRQFDEIVAFAGVEEFIDTPVKRYSSGMYLRLAFAVAAHLQAEILLIDEVLAVGDFAFQRKCLGKMNDIARSSGRTIVFVSHNMATIESLCDKCVLLDSGQLAINSSPHEALSRYVATQSISSTGSRSLVVHPGRRSHYKPSMQWVELYSENAPSNGVIRMGASLSIIVSYVHERPVRPLLGAVIKTLYGAGVCCVSDRYCGEQVADTTPRSCGRIICTIDDLRLMPGTYMIDLYIGEAAPVDFDVIIDAISFEVVAADLNGTGRLAPSGWGPMFCSGRFQLVPEEGDLTSPSYNDSTSSARPEGS